ncbi:hypothetical protein N7454_008807 [Penicillium verhagenii]|nr:hypothetical protein N7454_008807 [Penicillium verhagenii]
MPRRSTCSRSRQKSCIACAEGKRRCNRQTPQCSRCLARGVQCSYINRSSRQTETYPQSESAIAITFPDYYSYYSDDLLSLVDATGPIFYHDDHIENDSWLTMDPSSLLAQPALSAIQKYPELSKVDKWATQQIMQSIKSFPRLFLQHGKTPFIHARLYDSHLPDAIQDAFSVSAAYCIKNPQTEDMVFRMLESKASSLMGRDYSARSLDTLLAAVQALMLFHIMQLFDGNIRQRSIAEQSLATLKSMTVQLHTRAAELTPSSTWEAWIFAESIRRTVIMSLFIEGLYSVLKSGFCESVPTLSLLPFTAGGELWDATTDSSWLAKCQQGGTLDVVLYGDFTGAWEKGVVPNLNPFEKFLLTPCMGEKYREFLELDDCIY